MKNNLKIASAKRLREVGQIVKGLFVWVGCEGKMESLHLMGKISQLGDF